jgi:hypothetical protein
MYAAFALRTPLLIVPLMSIGRVKERVPSWVLASEKVLKPEPTDVPVSPETVPVVAAVVPVVVEVVPVVVAVVPVVVAVVPVVVEVVPVVLPPPRLEWSIT